MPTSYIPTFISLISVILGFFGIKHTIYGEYNIVFIIIITMCIVDFLDGFIARKLKAVSVFGGQVDSLCDAFAFGIFPAICSYLWLLSDLRSVGIILCGLIVCALIFRLARYNALQILNVKEYKGVNLEKYFVGIPAPMFGFLIILPIALFATLEINLCTQYLETEMCHYSVGYLIGLYPFRVALSLYYLIICYLGISTIPIIALKSIPQRTIKKVSAVLIPAMIAMLYMYGITEFVLTLGLVMLIYIMLSMWNSFLLKKI